MEVEAANVRRLLLDSGRGFFVQQEIRDAAAILSALDDQFPGMSERLSEGTSVAINGEIIADALFEELPEGAEVHFLETLSGG